MPFDTYQPLHDKVVIQELKIKGDQKTDGGLYIPDSAKREIVEGTVFAAGEGRYASESGVFMPTKLAKGDTVIYPKDAGIEISLVNNEGVREDMRLMTEGDVLLLVKKAEK